MGSVNKLSVGGKCPDSLCVGFHFLYNGSGSGVLSDLVRDLDWLCIRTKKVDYDVRFPRG